MRQNPDPKQRRSVVTPDSFTVSPELVGLPLARPWRRALAMFLDLIGIALLARAGFVFLGIALAFTLWRASAPRTGLRRTALRVGAVALPLFVLAVANPFSGGGNEEPTDRADEWMDFRSIPDIIALETSTDSAAIDRAARNLTMRLATADIGESDREEIESALLEEVENAQARRILAGAFGARPPAETAPTDSVILDYAAAIEQGDTVAADSLSRAARDALAGERIRRLEQNEDELQERIEALQEERGGFTGFIRNVADDLGIGFGWGALYFTAFVTLWRGQTPGKRLLGVRVIRLDGRALGWWLSFERFGGYAASLSTGLLGFLQILWDHNRQGLHDKAVETVVIRDLPASLVAGEGWRHVSR